MCFPSASQAFYQVQNDDVAIELRGLVRAIGIAANNPNDVVLFEHDKILTGGGFGRLMLDIQTSEFSIEAHAVQSYIEPALRTGGSRFSSGFEIERSDALHWRFAGQHADLVVDRLNVQFSSDNLTIKLGRQPINLASTYYFTPNDFFAPFAAQTFYRTHKPGVDSARLDWQWGELSQLSLYTVLNYPLDNNHSADRQTSPDWSETSVLARASTLTDTFEWAVLFGKDHGDDIVGIDFQGELFDWLGVRGEGHLRFPDEQSQSRDVKFSLGLEHRFESSLTLRLEQFYQRSGASNAQSYSRTTQISNGTFYLARNYTALGTRYEFSPLFNGDIVYLYNHNDQSSLVALYATYSLSDESELSMGANIAIGQQPQNGTVQSEFGSYSKSINVEYRIYF
ncbi:MAG: hypothetical protein P1P93_11280 [Gammaproteobacteria bacterium]|nr:hypothetical protein [Gammaproteobacteria bacterium]